MNRIHALAGAILGVLVLTLGVAQAAPGGASQPDNVLPRTSFEPSTVAPRARPGSSMARQGRLSGKSLRRKLSSRMRSAGGASGAWVYDLDAKRSPVLFTDHASKRRILASNTKLFTTTALAGRYGAKHRFVTRAWIRGKVRGRTLKGNVAMLGAGDPALSSESFARNNGLPQTQIARLAKTIKRKGISKITGNVVADPSIFDGRSAIPQPGVSGGPYLGPLSGLSYDSGFENGHYSSNPARVAAEALKSSLRKNGVKVGGKATVGRIPSKIKKKKRFAATQSPTVATLLAATNKPSNNFFAEMLLKRLAAGGAKPATTKAGAKKAERFARKHGSGVSMVNGSGLSRSNKASPHDVGKLLVAAKREKRLRQAVPASLSIAGRDGTLAGRMRGTAAEGRCRGKTGTLDGVSALSGYCSRHGHTIAFSILMNGISDATAHNAQDAMVAAIARYSK
ncbi:hypothetical protein BH10ACT11_BH10ACT11_13840 [soil metagenome]